MIFCNECRKINESSDKCLGSPYVTPHKSVMRLLPIEHLIHFASSNIKGPKEGKYTTNIFFKHTEVKEKKPKNIQSEDFKIIRFREEQWKKYGTVLVKRKDGHFVTWGQID